MINLFKFFCQLMILLFLVSCSSDLTQGFVEKPQKNLKGEYIYRKSGEYFYKLDPPKEVERGPYPWESVEKGKFPKITKEFFRCKGSILNPVRLVQKKNETVRYYDCGGTQKHSLPLKDGKEFVYPILLELLNYLQNKTEKKVVITCGHCCPDHNLYLDSSTKNESSKHLLGAEVDFYIQGLENSPEKVVEFILNFYKEKYKGKKEFEFKRYEKETNVKTLPWFNKEIFVKLYKKDEGRDFDNRHPYPYIGLQVLYDLEREEKVSYSWDKAFHHLHRW